MFFTGTLQEGVGQAIQEKKRVVCFVHSDDNESKTWQDDYLQPLNEILQDYAVVLKLEKDSTEAGYLGAICPVDQAPMVAVIYNGQVKGTLKPPQTLEQFRQELLTAMDLDFRMSGGSGPAQAQSLNRPTASQSVPAPAPVAATQPATSSSPALSDAMADRRRRMAELEAAEERRKQEAQEARRQAARDPNSNEAYQAKLAEEKKKQRQKATEERKRVLDLIEADKKQRRDQAAQRVAERNAQKQLAEADAEAEAIEETPAEITQSVSSSAGAGGKCRLQLRLWNGQTERAEFMALQTLSHVKEWLDKNVDEPRSGPYTLREVIGTGAARQLDVADDRETLSSLGLTPSATLIVSPASNASKKVGRTKISVSTRLGPFFWLFELVFGLLLAIWTILTRLIRADHRNTGSAGQQEVPGNESTARASGAQPPSARIQTLDDRKKKDKPTLYNGNQLGVLPNPNNEDNDDDDNDGE